LGTGEPDALFLNKYFSILKSVISIIKIIPKGARLTISEEFSLILNRCVSKNDVRSWINLLLFPYAVLAMPINSKSNRKNSLTTLIKNQLTIWIKNKTLPTEEVLEFYNQKKIKV